MDAMLARLTQLPCLLPSSCPVQVLRIPPWPTVECFWGNWSVPSTTTTTPDTAPGPSPAPAASPAIITCGSELVELELTLTGEWG